jgi:amidohydrolase
MRDIRREVHRHPELSNEEHATAELVAQTLERLGASPVRYAGFTGVTATIAPKATGPTVALRADLDALPVTERTGVPFASRNAGRMHACGHDLHVAALLGAARLALEAPERLVGPLRLLFQPAEEDGKVGGAMPLIRRGALEGVRYVLGQHVEQTVPVGSVAYRPGAMMAAADWFDITVRGRGGHAGYPQSGPDAVVVASEIVVGLQALVSREKDPVEAGVISVGMIHGGERPNILPSEVNLSGTVRTFSEPLREQFQRAIARRAVGIAKSLGADATVEYRRGYPPVVNDLGVTAAVAEGFRQAFGPRRAPLYPVPVMGAEDFSCYLTRRPGCFWWLGVATPGRSMADKHSPNFLPDERALVTGAEALLVAAESVQRRGP